MNTEAEACERQPSVTQQSGDNPAQDSPPTDEAAYASAHLPLELALLIAAQDGDMEAYEDLQLLLEPDLRRYVRRLINGADAEDDILQEVFISFYTNLHRIQPPDNLRPYLFRIARNRCYDEFRRWGRKELVSLDDEPVQLRVAFTEAHHQPKPDDLTHWMLLQLEVREAIDRLPDAQREALILYSEESLSYAEIATIMDCSVGTVKSRLFHARKSLRGLLRPETIEVLDDEFGDKPASPAKQSPERNESHHERQPQPEP